jgi:F0F1-type ATP synthase delta subunit
MEGNQKSKSVERRMASLTLELTADQKKALREFWAEHHSLGNVEIKVDVVNDKISPASIQVGTAK